MEELKRKYAKFILEGCLKVKEGQPLYVSGWTYTQDFTDLVVEEAKKIGVTDIYLEIRDRKKMRECIETLSIEECVKSTYFDRTKMNEYALKNAAFVLCTSMVPHSMDGVDATKLGEVNKLVSKSIETYRDLQHKLPWCIFGVANESWAKELFPNEKDALTKLWNLIFDICHIKDEDPVTSWKHKMELKERQANYLNALHIATLHYKNGLGTDIKIGLPEGYVFTSAKENAYIVNMPSEEVFASPDYRKTEGIVYSSKPLLYNGVFIDHFSLRFEKGRVAELHAEEGEEMLRSIVSMDEGAHYLGECALVDDDSPISNSNVLFQDTLFDENASCHFALGRGFEECIKNGEQMTKEERYQKGINDSCTHVDFMIGTSDMEIIATTQDGEEVVIMKNGNLVIE